MRRARAPSYSLTYYPCKHSLPPCCSLCLLLRGLPQSERFGLERVLRASRSPQVCLSGRHQKGVQKAEVRRILPSALHLTSISLTASQCCLCQNLFPTPPRPLFSFSLTFHPDKLRQRGETLTDEMQEKFRKIKQAYEVGGSPPATPSLSALLFLLALSLIAHCLLIPPRHC